MREPAMKPIRIVSAAQRSYDRALSCDRMRDDAMDRWATTVKRDDE